MLKFVCLKKKTNVNCSFNFFLENWYKSFHKDYPSGQLTSEEFKKIYAQFFPAGDSAAFAKHVFRRFDADKNQRISFREFLTALSITSKGNLEEKLNWAFGLYDTNDDGFITKEEMLEIVTVCLKIKITINFKYIIILGNLSNGGFNNENARR